MPEENETHALINVNPRPLCQTRSCWQGWMFKESGLYGPPTRCSTVTSKTTDDFIGTYISLNVVLFIWVLLALFLKGHLVAGFIAGTVDVLFLAFAVGRYMVVDRANAKVSHVRQWSFGFREIYASAESLIVAITEYERRSVSFNAWLDAVRYGLREQDPELEARCRAELARMQDAVMRVDARLSAAAAVAAQRRQFAFAHPEHDAVKGSLALASVRDEDDTQAPLQHGLDDLIASLETDVLLESDAASFDALLAASPARPVLPSST